MRPAAPPAVGRARRRCHAASLGALLALSGPSAAAAAPEADGVGRWRLLGPSLAWHFGREAAIVTAREMASTWCYEATRIAPDLFVSQVPQPGLEPAARTPDGRYVYRSAADALPAACVRQVTPERRAGFRETNPALGLEHETRHATHADKLFATVVRDSYDRPSLMVGAARLWPLLAAGSVAVDGGVSAGLWSRTVLNAQRSGVERRVVPFVLPVLSLDEARSGLGLNAALAPRLRWRGRHANRTPTLMLQSSLRLSSTARAETPRVELGVAPDGGLRIAWSLRH